MKLQNLFTVLIDCGTPAYDEVMELRDTILRKPLGLDYSVEQLSEEYTDLHLACYAPGFQLKGCLVLTPKSEKLIKMRQVAVWEDCQRQGVGKKMVEDCEELVKSRGFSTIELNARDVSIEFYESLGYHKVGDEFIEVSIKHFKMEKEMKCDQA